MARPKPKVPPFRVHKATGQAYVNLNGNRRYLGRADDPATLERYNQKIAEWIAQGRTATVAPESITVAEVLDRFLTHAETHYKRPDGKRSTQRSNFSMVFKSWRELYGRTPATAFGPVGVRALRQRFIDKGWSRGGVNRGVSLVRQTFKWAAGHELIPVATYAALTTVEPLLAGRTEAHDCDPVKPVPQEWIDAVLPRVSRQVAALIRLQLLTAARAGELTITRPVDLDMGGSVWMFKPSSLKGT